ncbi:MAG UNVERIFIED_CONTAM: N-6 DNA methylase, partial [Thermobifida fusca]
IFLVTVEERGILHGDDLAADVRALYNDGYSMRRLVDRSVRRSQRDRHHDKWAALRPVFAALGRAGGEPKLGLPELGGLFAPGQCPHLDTSELGNRALLEAVFRLGWLRESSGLSRVNWKDMGPEELGSIYESLLELHPQLNVDARTFALATASGHERKTTGSYYTPASLIAELLDSALEPVLDEAIKNADDPEEAILSLKVVDPAAGSGHFLVAAAHRMAKRLAAVRTGDDEPSPEAIRTALRDVIGRCIYGVDINPMAVELCKVSLWLEAMDPGKPLTFLDHHIQCGNSLLGATPRLLAEGIPDAAFTPIEGDDKKYVAEWKKRNRQERAGQLSFYHELSIAPPWERLGNLADALQKLDTIPDDTPAGVRKRQEVWEQTVRSSDYLYTRLWADAWCAAFVWKKTKDAEFAYPITERTFREIERNPHSIAHWMREEIQRLAEQYQFFHWHIAFPDVFRVPAGDEKPDNEQAGWIGGFDVVLGNPPWEHTELKEKEFFAQRRPDIATAQTGAARKRMIAALQKEDPALFSAYSAALRQADGLSHLVRNSGRYPLCGRGRINTYAIFAETNRLLVSPTGRVGCIVPSGIATDDTTKFFFQDLVDTGSLVSLYDFENREKLFPAVDSRMKFCLLTLAGSARPSGVPAEFVFFAHHVDDLRDDERRFTLTADDLALLNPNTRTCPIFRSKRDAEITKAIYRRVPVLIKEGPPEENPWGIRFLRMFDMSNDSHLFRTREQLEAEGWRLEGNVFACGGERYLPLYEAKMLHQFDHRWATYEGLDTRDMTAQEKDDPTAVALPRYWVPEAEVRARLAGKWDRGWLLGWRDICRSTDERTVIASVLPRVGSGDTFLLMFPAAEHVQAGGFLLANLDSFIHDFAARQKVGGTHLKYHVFKQLPLLPPERYTLRAAWKLDTTLGDWLTQRVLELTYTAWDMQPFARDLGYNGPPFRWDEERRFLLRCELDAAFFHLYGIARDDVDYIMETFPIVKRKDEAAHGEYRTKRVILEIYDDMAEAMRTGVPYQTRLAPPPADPRVAHQPATTGQGPTSQLTSGTTRSTIQGAQ